MSRIMNRSALALALALVVVALTATVGTTLAYFTTYADAKGSLPLALAERTQITEEFSDWTKHVEIANAEGADAAPVFVRVKAFSGSSFPLIFTDTDGKWSPGTDDYYYFADPVAPGDRTSVLDVRIDGVPAQAAVGDAFNVVVVYECTPVLYDADGNPYADWRNVLNNGTLDEGGEA